MRVFHVLVYTLCMAVHAFAQTTVFTYQGELNENGTLVNGTFDLRFRLFDVAEGGSPLGSTLCANNVPVSEGKFSVSIDFGEHLQTAAQRFLEIEVRADAGLECANAGGFLVLSPRQAITPAPRANFANIALTSFMLAAADGTPANAVIVDNNGKVGIGTTSPTHTLHVAETAPTIAIQDTDSSANQVGYVSFRDNGNVERAWVGFGQAGDPDFSIINTRTGGDIVLNALGSSRVGIGTSSPLAALDVRGDIRLGNTGQLRARGEENLRIIRGTVNEVGGVVRGSGFTVQRTAPGKYVITFTTPFAGVPTVTATALRGLETFIINFDNTVPASNSQVGLVTYSTALDDFVGTQFDFIAIGPR